MLSTGCLSITKLKGVTNWKALPWYLGWRYQPLKGCVNNPKGVTKGELLKLKNFVTLIHLTGNTDKKQSKRNCSSTKPAQETNLNGKVISTKRSWPVSRELPTHILFFLFNQNRFASVKTTKQDQKKKRIEIEQNEHQSTSRSPNLHWNEFTGFFVCFIWLCFTESHLQYILLCFLQFRHLFSSSFNNLLRVALQDFYFGLTTEAKRCSWNSFPILIS